MIHPSAVRIYGGTGVLNGELVPPPDKSISHRALFLSLLVQGQSVITDLLHSQDTEATKRMVVALGATVSHDGANTLIESAGASSLREPDGMLDCGNSGTTARIGLGVLSHLNGFAALTGDPSLIRRPMNRIVAPLRTIGAVIDGRDNGNRFPLAIRGGCVKGGDVILSVASAQVKSAILIAGLGAPGRVTVTEPMQTRSHTEEMLKLAGVELTRELLDDGRVRYELPPGQLPRPLSITVERDPSSAAFFVCAAAAVPGSHLEVQGTYAGRERTGYLDVLARMGAKITREAISPTREHLVIEGAELEGVLVSPTEVPSMIDEFPALCVAWAFAKGSSEISGAEELRVKESDRIGAMASLLSSLGATVEEFESGLRVAGVAERMRPGELLVDPHHDHRVAMASCLLGAVSHTPVTLAHPSEIATSYPGFMDDLIRLTGVSVRAPHEL